MIRFAFVILLLVPCVETLAQAFVPSKFIDGGEAFLRKVKPPIDFPSDRVVVYVTGDVDTSGRLANPTTWNSGNDELELFEKAVELAASAISLSPAVVDSKKRSVWFSFSVVFEHVDGEVEVSVLPYLYSGEGDAEPTFSAPQRVTSTQYPNTCKYRRRVIWSSMQISAAGIPSKPEVVGAKGRCKKSLRKILLESTYIPAIFNGSAIDSGYLEPWFIR